MTAFIYNNLTIIIIAGIILYLVILYFILKKLPTKASKKSKVKEKKEEVKEEIKKIPDDKKEVEPLKPEPEEIEEKTQNPDKKVEKDDKKPKIVQIYKREQKNETVKKEEKIDPIYDRNVEFVNVSKNVSKFKSFSDDKKEEVKSEVGENQTSDEFGFVTEKQDDCEFCQDNVKHFDHSRRLSTAIKSENFDDMFASHISDKYLNINPDKYVSVDFHKSLYERTDDMMNNSVGKVAGTSENRISLFESENIAEDFDGEIGDNVQVNMKTALIADTYFNRKKKK